MVQSRPAGCKHSRGGIRVLRLSIILKKGCCLKEILIAENKLRRFTMAATNLGIGVDDGHTYITNGTVQCLFFRDTPSNREKLNLVLTSMYVHLIGDPKNDFMMIERDDDLISVKIRRHGTSKPRYVFHTDIERHLL